MDQELKQKIEELLVLAKLQGVSIVGLADLSNEDTCHIFRTVEHDCKQGTRNLEDILIRQSCDGNRSNCATCHKTKPMFSDDGLAQLFAELQLSVDTQEV
ncbi:hypothetical protein VTH8203_01227 [Vibrio thalassae]|uniref:Uncharacterized protein n=1 Tax=Vibrio thalassae TaxID=1243014 RepID=A0A240EG13_9VIBR|nr:hypothetical protein [Vibrio thalassae]SNX47612.1 hypothetical protein VTH8203_01227 [Vibrio thalassae]